MALIDGMLQDLQARSADEVTDMTKRFLEVAGDGETEIRPVYELSDFPAGDAIDHHARLRDELGRN